MSRGPGRWQRGILAAVEALGIVYLRDLLPDDARKSEITAVERAAATLEARGEIQIHRYAFWRPRVLLLRRGARLPAGRPKPAAHRPVSVGNVTDPTPCPHLHGLGSKRLVGDSE